MRPDVQIVDPRADIMSAVKQMVEHNVSVLIVVHGPGTLVGILTERDCIDAALHAGYFGETGGAVENYMSSDVTTVGPDLGMMDLAESFGSTPFRRFPVVEQGKLVGVVTRRDVLRALASGQWFSKPSKI